MIGRPKLEESYEAREIDDMDRGEILPGQFTK